MRKLFLLIILLSTFASAQIPSRFYTNNEINQTEISTEADLINASNTGKTFCFANDITLTQNRTLPANVVIEGCGYKITGAFTLTLNNTGFKSSDAETTIIDNNVTLAGTNNPNYNVFLEWFGAVRHTETTDFDNKKVFDNALVAGKDSYVYVNEGHYKKGVVEISAFSSPRPNTVITGNTHVIGAGKDQTRISTLVNDALLKSAAFVISNAPNGSFEHIWLEGDLLVTADQQNEQRHGLLIENDSHDFTIEHNRISHFTGDNIYNEPHGDYNNDYLVFEDGTINDSGVDAATTIGEKRSALKSFSAGVLINNKGQLTGGSYGSYDSLVDYSYKLYFYNTSNVFISRTDWVMTYKDIELPTNATKYRVVISKTVGGANPTILQFRGLRHSLRVNILHNEIDHAFRNGISNLSAGFKVIYNYFHHNGGRVGGPGYGIGLEDGYQSISDGIISYNTFENNFAGDITLRWVRDITIEGNIFLGKNDSSTERADINARETWSTKFINNTLYNTIFTGGRQSYVDSNIGYNSDITLVGSQGKAVNNTLFNGIVRPNEAGMPDSSISQGNSFYVQRPITGLFGFGNPIISDGDTVILQNNLDLHENWFYSLGTTGTATQDTIPRRIERLTVYGDNQISAVKGMKIPAMDIEKSSFNQGIVMVAGAFRGFELKNNNYKYFIDIQAPNNSGTFYDVVIDGGTIESNITGTPVGVYGMIRSSAIDINLVVKNMVIDLGDGAASRFTSLKHNGTTKFINCTFKQDVAGNWDLNLSYTAVTLNTATNFDFSGCTFINVTPLLRAGDTNN